MIDPSTIGGAVIWGVVSGLVTTALLLVLGLFTSKVVLPWYTELIYKGVDLRGVWTQETETDTGRYFTAKLELEQRAHRISGRGMVTITKSGADSTDYVQFFSIEGAAWEGFLNFNMRSTDRKSLSFVAGLVKVSARGDVLEGHWVYRGSTRDQPEAESVRLVRQKNG